MTWQPGRIGKLIDRDKNIQENEPEI